MTVRQLDRGVVGTYTIGVCVQVIEVSAMGWSVVDARDVRFCRPKALRPDAYLRLGDVRAVSRTGVEQ